MRNLSQEEQLFIEDYKQTKKDTYDKPSVTADIVLFTVAETPSIVARKRAKLNLQVLLVQRDTNPFKGYWSLAGSFMQTTERLDTTVKRSLYTEVGLTDIYAEQLYTFSEVERDPRMRVLSTAYMSLVNKKNTKIGVNNSQLDSSWFTLKLESLSKMVSEDNTISIERLELTLYSEERNIMLKSILQLSKEHRGMNVQETLEVLESDLAFDHAEIIVYALQRLRNKLSYTTLAFNLLEEEFTLPKLQDVYELILDKPLYKSLFRKQMEPLIEETGNEIQEGAFRPSKTYKFKGIPL